MVVKSKSIQINGHFERSSMMKKYIIAFLLFTGISLSPHLLWSVQPLKFSNISIGQGLSQTTVFDIIQDQEGNLWVGTADGLNRYDSYTFTIFRHRHNDSLSIHDNTIRTLKADSNSILWIGTRRGLSRYNAEKEVFHNFTLSDGEEKIQVQDIEILPTGKLILATTQGIYLFDKQTCQFEVLPALKNTSITALAVMERQILVGTQQGLYLYTPANHQITPIVPEFSSYAVNAIQYIPYKGFWVGTEGNGLYFVNTNFQVSRRFRHGGEGGLSSDFVRTICLDYEQRLWVGTFVGLNIYNAETDSFDVYYHDIEDNSTISQNSIRVIFPDDQGGIWLGTYFCGLDYYHPLQNRFGLIRQNLKPNSLSDNVISCITEDPETGNIWIGTNDNGINYYYPEQNRFRYFYKDETSKDALVSNNIKCILPDLRGNIYVGTHGGGLSYVWKNTGRSENYTVKNSGILNNNVYALLSDPENEQLWLGTLKGLQLFNPHTKRFSPHFLTGKYPGLKDVAIFYLFRDTSGRIWIGTENNLFCYEPHTRKLETMLSQAKGQAIGQVLCIQEDQARRIWAGTRTGLYRIGNGVDTTEVFTTDNGLPNDVIYGILEDSYGRLWLSTNQGLVCFDVRNRSFRTYTESDGIQSNQFNIYSFCKTSRGRFYFGGVRGITHFQPEHLQDNPFTPEAHLVQLTLFNREVSPNDASGLLTKTLSQTSKLTFRAGQNFFGLRFTVPNFLSACKNTFLYKLEGFDKDWYRTTTPEVSYSNLSPGNYTFKLNVANNDGKWSPHITTLRIEILPPWYQSWWAKILLFLFLGFIGYAVFHFYRTRLTLRKNEEINQMKVRFFVNITNELRTPLTLIISPLQEILQRGVSDKWLRGQIESIQRSANRLLNLVNQTLDYRRAELGVFVLKVYRQPVESVTRDIFTLFSKYARQKEITYEFIPDLPQSFYPIDRNYLERILLNLLSNAFKYTPNGGKITLAVREEKDQLLFEISDTGCGIAKEEQEKIFQRFYHIYKDQMSSGIGLALVKVLVERHHGEINLNSVPGEGSVFRIAFPARDEAYMEKEWDTTGNGECSQDLPLSLAELSVPSSPVLSETDPEKPEQTTGTILLINGDEEIKRYLIMNLQPHYRVLTASSGEEGLAQLKQTSVDLILIDRQLPGTDPLKFCKSIKQNIYTCHIYVLLINAENNTSAQLHDLASGVDDTMPSPFVFALLQAKINALIKAKRRVESHCLSVQDLKPETVGFNAADEELLKRCREVIEKNLDQVEFTVDDLSRELGMSRSTLHLKLKSITGESTIEFVRKIKFEHACRLLIDGRYSIAEISAMVGFNTPSYFAGSFKKQMGCLPTEYIKKMKN